MLIFLAINFYIKINAQNAGNVAYQALISSDLNKLSRVVHFVKDKDMSINGKSLLIYAVENSNLEAVKILENAGCDCDKEVGGTTALLQALREGKLDIAQIFITDYKGNVNTYVFTKPYIAVMIDENNYDACAFLLNQKDTDTKILINNEPLSLYLFKKEDLNANLSKLFSDKLVTDSALNDYLNSKYNILNFGGAYAIVTSDVTVPYIIQAKGDNGFRSIILFDSEKFSRYIYPSLSLNSSYIAFYIQDGSQSLKYISGINNYSSFSDDKKTKIADSIEKYFENNMQNILNINNKDIFSITPLLFLKDFKSYSIDDMFAIDDEVFSIISDEFVNITANVDKNKVPDISYQKYYNGAELQKAMQTMYFTLRFFPLCVSESIEDIYLVKYANVKNSGIAINGAFSGANSIIIAKSVDYTTMAVTYIHEFSHFITKDSDRKTIADITKKYSKYGYYENYTGGKYYGIACVTANGEKKNYYDIYADLIKLNQSVFFKDGFVRDYSTYNSWEDFADSAESMYSYIGSEYFMDYVKQNGYNAIAEKFNYVKSEYNNYSSSSGGDEFMNDNYFTKVKEYLNSYGYNYPQMQP
ncbi:MAG: ankyrin repeat domain-containing protein [Eubacteriaceae bacterium]|nr:ankyrin repeat domain-containing protein [Eubacteriaceae bacterium]